MNKKRLVTISVVVLATMAIGVGTAFAANDNQGATLEEKLEAIEERVDDEDMTQEEADTIIEQITSCDADCDGTGECEDRPEEGRGIFGNGENDGTGARRGAADGTGNGAGNGAKDGAGNGAGDGTGNGAGNGNGVCDGTCDAA